MGCAECQRERSWPNLKQYPMICLERLRKIYLWIRELSCQLTCYVVPQRNPIILQACTYSLGSRLSSDWTYICLTQLPTLIPDDGNIRFGKHCPLFKNSIARTEYKYLVSLNVIYCYQKLLEFNWILIIGIYKLNLSQRKFLNMYPKAP